MFKNSVGATSLSSDAANLYFSHITGDSFGTDVTFLSSLRALLGPRIPEGDTVRLYFDRSGYGAGEVGSTPWRTMVERICSNMSFDNGMLCIHSIGNRSQEDNLAVFSLLQQKFTEAYPDYHRLEKVTDFYRKSFNALCFVNPECKNTVLFIENLDIRKLHYLQCSILAILPWYFNPDDGITDDELALLEALRSRTPEAYIAAIEKIAASYDFETGRIKNLLRDFESAYERAEVSRVRQEIDSIDRDLESLSGRLADYLKRRNDKCIHLLGLETRIASGRDEESEIMEYFLCNRRLYLESVDTSRMVFSVRDYLTYYDEEAARQYITNNRSYLYEYCTDSLPAGSLKKLLTAIFLDETLRIKFCASYRFDLSGSVSPNTTHDFSGFGYAFSECMPNPHIDRYRCMGNYEGKINSLLKNRDYIGAIEQCVASAKSLNFHDSTVMGEFVRQLCSTSGKNNRCIQLPDGSVVNPREAIRFLEETEAIAEPESPF